MIDDIQAGRFDGFTLERGSSGLELFVGGRRATSMEPARWDLEVRLRDMDRMGVTIQALSPLPLLLGYELPRDQGVRLCRLINDGLARSAAAHPDRFVPLAAVPLQGVDEAVRELHRAVGELGMRGVEIGANIDSADPSEERFCRSGPRWRSWRRSSSSTRPG